MAKSRLPCLGMIGPPSVGGVHPHFMGPVGLARESATQALQLCAQLQIGHAVTVKMPSGLRKGVSSGGSSCPSSLQTWMMAWATAKRLLRVSSGLSPQATQPLRVGTSARYIQPWSSAGSCST